MIEHGNHRLKSVPLKPTSERPTAAATEFGAGRIGGIASGAKNFDGSWRVPGDRASAQRGAATPTELCARWLFHAATGAANLGTTQAGLVQAGRAGGLGRRSPRMNRTVGSDGLKIRIATAATELRAPGKARPALGAGNYDVCRQGHPGNAAETPTL